MSVHLGGEGACWVLWRWMGREESGGVSPGCTLWCTTSYPAGPCEDKGEKWLRHQIHVVLTVFYLISFPSMCHCWDKVISSGFIQHIVTMWSFLSPCQWKSQRGQTHWRHMPNNRILTSSAANLSFSCNGRMYKAQLKTEQEAKEVVEKIT